MGEPAESVIFQDFASLIAAPLDGSLTSLAAYGVPTLSFMSSIVNYVIGVNFFNGDITPAMMVYLGTATVLCVQFLSAAYLVVKATASAISFIDGFAFQYRL